MSSEASRAEPSNKRKGGSSLPGSQEEQLSRTKSKMGRPQRKQTYSKADTDAPGRVSVYCVGSAIDLNALRAHVFRRGFGNQHNDSNPSELILTRKSGEDDLDDEVLHVSNAPLFYSASESQMVSTAAILDGKDEKMFWNSPNAPTMASYSFFTRRNMMNGFSLGRKCYFERCCNGGCFWQGRKRPSR